MFRYAEGLLCYAEAAAELNKYDDNVAAKTIKALRERAGVKYITPTTDPNFPFTGISPVIQEIRVSGVRNWLFKGSVWMI